MAVNVTTDDVWAKVKELKELAANKFHRSKEPDQPDQMRAYYTGQYDALCTAAKMLDAFVSEAEKATP